MAVSRSRPTAGGADAGRVRRRTAPSKGLPASLLLALGSLGLVVFALLAYQVLARGAKEATLKRARTHAEMREFDEASAILAGIPEDGSRYDREARSIEAQMRAERDRIARDQKVAEGEGWWRRSLENFESKGLRVVTPPAARVFVERCDEFLRLYPGHPREAWVKERRATYAAGIDLSKPLGWADVEYRATLARSREEFAEAKRLVQDYLGGAGLVPDEAALARDFLERLDTGARSFFERKWKEVEEHVSKARYLDAEGLLLALEARTGIEELAERARRERERVEAIRRRPE